MSNPLQPLSPDRLYRFAQRLGSCEKLFSLVFSSAAANNNNKSVAVVKPKTQQELDAERDRKFAALRAARSKKVNSCGEKTYEDCYDKITKEEMDYILELKLRVPALIRYQKMKIQPRYHPSSWFMRGLDAPDGQGCDYGHECIRSCRYYAETGRIEDWEIIKEHEKELAERTAAGTLIL